MRPSVWDVGIISVKDMVFKGKDCCLFLLRYNQGYRKTSSISRTKSQTLTHLGLVSHICVLKNSSHFPSDAYMRHKSLYFTYRPRGRPTKQCQAKMSLMFLVSSCSCLRSIYWSQVLSWEWRCSWSSADRRCSNYIWVINKFIAY